MLVVKSKGEGCVGWRANMSRVFGDQEKHPEGDKIVSR